MNRHRSPLHVIIGWVLFATGVVCGIVAVWIATDISIAGALGITAIILACTAFVVAIAKDF